MDWFRKEMERGDEFFLFRLIGGSAAAALAVLSAATAGIGDAFLFLCGLAVIVFVFPWRRLSALKAGPLELSLSQGQIRGAIDSIDVHGAEKERINGILARLEGDLERARGSRVLWVDDKPRRVVGERRLFRALEIETVPVATCDEAAQILTIDNDFDLVITSLEKAKERERIRTHNPGVVFGQWLRGEEGEEIRVLVGEDAVVPIRDPVINNLPVVFYAAFPLTYIREMIQPLYAHEPPVEASRSLDDLLKKSLRLLADLRSSPIEVSSDKKILAG